MTSQTMFQENSMVVYPAHGVGEIRGIETQTIGGMEITAYVVNFEHEKMTLRIPVSRAESSGLRKLCSAKELSRVNRTLKSRPKIGRGMWSRRAKEYESKINSGSIVLLAEVVRDLHKNVDDPDRSYSERIIYENAFSRLAGEVAVVEEVAVEDASSKLIKTINDSIPKEIVEEDTLTKAPVLDENDNFDNDLEEAA